MFRPLRLRFFLIVLLLFFALFWDFNKGELRTTIQTGVCEEFDYANRSCQSGPNLFITSYPAMLIDPVALLIVLGLTYLGSWFRQLSTIIPRCPMCALHRFIWNGTSYLKVRQSYGSMSESWVTKISLRDMACVISIR